MRTFVAKREFIRKGIELKSGKTTTELYDLETSMYNAIRKVAEWREENFDEPLFEEAIPQTLLSILDHYETNSSKVAAQCFLEVPAKNYGEGKKIQEE